MTPLDTCAPRPIAVSISESPDMGVYGLGLGHLREALADFAIHLLASGDDLAYGGDLREHGFTELLFELVARYRQPAETRVRPPVTNYLAWPVHIRMPAEKLHDLESDLRGSAQFALLGHDGSRLTMDDRRALQRHDPDHCEWTDRLLAHSPYVDEVVDLVLRGLERLRGSGRDRL